MRTSENGIHMIESHEGLLLRRYNDGAGVPTIGYGTTSAVISPLPESCTQTQAEAWLKLDVERSLEPALNAAEAASHKKLNQNQYDALIDAGYNLGAGIYSSAHTIGLDLRRGDFAKVSQDFLLYDRDIRGVAEPGLIVRRRAEQKLFDTPVVVPLRPGDPYEWFDRTTRDLSGSPLRHPVLSSEYGFAREYDAARRHAKVNALKLAGLRRVGAVLLARLESVMKSDPRGDAPKHRDWRATQLRLRVQGRQVVK